MTKKGAAIKAFGGEVIASLEAAGYPVKDNPAAAKDPKAAKKILFADPAQINKPLTVAILTYLVLLVTMVLRSDRGAVGRAFSQAGSAIPRCRCPTISAMAGLAGFLPTTAFAMVAATGDIYYGLWYPIVVAGLTLVCRRIVSCRKPSSAISTIDLALPNMSENLARPIGRPFFA